MHSCSDNAKRQAEDTVLSGGWEGTHAPLQKVLRWEITGYEEETGPRGDLGQTYKSDLLDKVVGSIINKILTEHEGLWGGTTALPEEILPH